MAGVKKVREGPEVSIKLECRGCNYLEIWAGMCDVHRECKKGAWCGVDSSRIGSSIVPPRKCPFIKGAIKKFDPKEAEYCQGLLDEIKRLKEKLEIFTKPVNYYGNVGTTYNCTQLVEIAKQALKGE